MVWESELNGWSAVTVIAGTNKMASKRFVGAGTPQIAKFFRSVRYVDPETNSFALS